MSVSETLYLPNAGMPQELERGRTQTVKLEVWRDGALAAPSAGTYSLYKPSNELLVSAGAVTVTASVATYSVTSTVLASTLALGEGYREEWALTMPDGVVHTFERDAALIRKRLYPVINSMTLETRYPELVAHRHAFDGWDDFIDEAWNDIKLRLIAAGHLPYLVRTPSSFRNLHLDLALSLIFRAMYSGLEGSSKWLELSGLHAEAFERAWGAANFELDLDHDGQADDPNERTGLGGAVLPNASPYTRYFRRFGLK